MCIRDRAVAAMAASLEDAYTVNKLSFWNGPLHAPEIYFFSRSGEVL